MGCYLREQNPAIRIVGVEPAASPLLTEGHAGPHPLQGIGANFVPEILDLSLVDEIIPVSGEDAFAQTRALDAGKTIVALLPDSSKRYLSTGIFA